MIAVVAATRLEETRFWSQSALGQSLRRLGRDGRLAPQIAFGNLRGLGEVYNECLTNAHDADILVFVHDDVWLDDYYLADRVAEGLKAFDVIGVAGNRRRVPHQPAWAFVDAKMTWDTRENLSGRVAHGVQPFGPISHYGPAPAACELLDGVLLALKASTAKARSLGFDPQFDFHFYDMDFCRTARQQGLRLGTWPIVLTHQSGGAFGTPRWQQKYREYLEKWKS